MFMNSNQTLKTGEFLVKQVSFQEIFIPEEFDEEQRMIASTIRSFIETEVYPYLDEIDKGDRNIMKQILKKSGELGLMGISVPQEYGGFGCDFVTQMYAAEIIGAAYSFSVAFMAHCGIGTLPIVYYGNEEQRKKYLPHLATGEMLGAYCLTEPGAGSDANSGKSNVRLSDDGKYYILNGQKMWITNGGFADTQIVFAKIDNDRVLSAFIVESAWPGVEIAPDEKKMGIKGSSTTQIFYNDVKVPVDNLLGKRGEGFRIALNILHMGRMKLGANVIGAAKEAINLSVKYANERKQFGQLISSFGAIKYKLAEMVIRTFAQESAIYRVSRNIDEMFESIRSQFTDYGLAAIEAISHYAVEDAILKVYGSEMLDYVVDEGVQIHGGMGYSAEMNIERAYRDSRINRIFEGTNEINRLLIFEAMLKRSLRGDYDVLGIGERILKTNDVSCNCHNIQLSYFERHFACIESLKNIAAILSCVAYKTFGRDLMNQQEVVNNISGVIMQIYLAESTALRVQKIAAIRGYENIAVYRDILDVFVHDSIINVHKNAVDAICSTLDGDEARRVHQLISKLTCIIGVNVKEARRRIANKLIEDNRYNF